VERPLQVALFATSVQFGGIERVLLNLLEHMNPGVELFPVVFTRTDTTETSFFDRLRELRMPHKLLYVNEVPPVNVANPIVNLWQVISLFRSRRFDLIHTHGYRADIFGLLLSRLFRIPLVSTCHGFIGNDRRLRFYNFLDARVLRRFTRVIAVSSKMKEDLTLQGVNGSRIRVITNAVPEVSTGEHESNRRTIREQLHFANDDFVFGYVGRLSEEKGINYLLEAAGTLAAQSSKVRVLIVGDGPRRGDLEQQALKGRFPVHATFAGFQSNTGPWYDAMDAFVLPSLTEGTPMALLEAMAHRLPVIASAVGGVPKVLTDGENGVLVPSADTERLSKAMDAVASSASLRASLSEKAVQTVSRQYDVQTWIEGVHDVYMETVREERTK
jgi:glycosyltransferase involved in cell wall biosynthesis